ncbi:hypothetical protein [Kribbella sp. NPDC049227]|uniref:hypothetical protein n=1 Tax=Kribbella sp. NPDC049227 TaxID=3364113 RepID=UPI00371BF7B7
MTSSSSDQPKAEQVDYEVSRLLEEIRYIRELARERGLAFSSLDREQLERKIRGETTNSPFIYAQAWVSGTSQGSSAYYAVYVSNPDPVGYFPFYVTIFFGLGNFSETDEAWSGRDNRWPALSSDRMFLAAGASTSFQVDYTTPIGVTPGTYNGNSVLWEGNWHDVGRSFDRGSFDVKVS